MGTKKRTIKKKAKKSKYETDQLKSEEKAWENGFEEELDHDTEVNSEKPALQALPYKSFRKRMEILTPHTQSHVNISANVKSSTLEFNDTSYLCGILKKNLAAHGFTHMFPVQEALVPWIINQVLKKTVITSNDACVTCPTGSGKTLAYILPIIQVLSHRETRKIRALVVLPTQDLAKQVYEAFRKLAEGTGVKAQLLSGKHSFANEKKTVASRHLVWGDYAEVDVVISTPGRLVDHLKAEDGLPLSDLELLVIDEADRVLHSSLHGWIYHLERKFYLDSVPKERTCLSSLERHFPARLTKLLFSATLTSDPVILSQISLFRPKYFTAGEGPAKYTLPLELESKVVICSVDVKPLVLYKLLVDRSIRRAMVFVDTQKAGQNLAAVLNMLGLSRSGYVSSTVSKRIREMASKRLNSERGFVLVCTDMQARGIDPVHLQCVVSYSAPRNLVAHVHRAGRTSRAGAKGLSITMGTDLEVEHFQRKLRSAHLQELEEIKVGKISSDMIEKYRRFLGQNA